MPLSPSAESAVAHTRAWVETAVIGLNLCPFAKGVQAKGQVRYVVTDAADAQALLAVLTSELQTLAAADAQRVDTTLLIHPFALVDFTDYNQFLDVADAALVALRLNGMLQIASFHPDYQFAGTEAGDVTNATNRAPYPTLQLLREESITRAVAAFPAADAIFEANIRTVEALGADGWATLQARCRSDAAAAVRASTETLPRP